MILNFFITTSTIFICLFNIITSLQAQDISGDNFEDAFFEENEDEAKDGVSLPLRGFVRTESSYQVDNPRWILAGAGSNLILEWKTDYGKFYGQSDFRANAAYDIENDSEYMKKNYRFEVIPQELYWSKAWEDVTLSAGKIITVWGKADILPVVDVLTAKDMTQFLFARPENIRLGQNEVVLDWFINNHELNFVLVPYPVFNRYTDRDHPYSILRVNNSKAPEGDRIEENGYKRKVEGAMRYNYMFDGGSIALFAGLLNNRDTIINSYGGMNEIEYKESHDIYYFAGTSCNIALSQFLIKGEIGYSQQILKQKQEAMTYRLYGDNVNLLSTMLGLDYNTTDTGSFLVEASMESVFSNSDNLISKRNSLMLGGGWLEQFFNDNFDIMISLFLTEGVDNLLFRGQVKYDFNDYLSTEFQYTGLYDFLGDDDGNPFEDMDRVDFYLVYAFDLE